MNDFLIYLMGAISGIISTLLLVFCFPRTCRKCLAKEKVEEEKRNLEMYLISERIDEGFYSLVKNMTYTQKLDLLKKCEDKEYYKYCHILKNELKLSK